MHTPSPPLTIGGTVLMESVDLDTLGVTNDFEIPFEKHLCSVTRATPKDLVSSGVLFCSVWSTVLQCLARLPIYTLNNWTL